MAGPSSEPPLTGPSSAPPLAGPSSPASSTQAFVGEPSPRSLRYGAFSAEPSYKTMIEPLSQTFSLGVSSSRPSLRERSPAGLRQGASSGSLLRPGLRRHLLWPDLCHQPPPTGPSSEPSLGAEAFSGRPSPVSLLLPAFSRRPSPAGLHRGTFSS
jgi:hypothetical protein